ncbi:MAG: ATP-binding cassette domain-containing protein [Chitinophagaceae bacterium]|nr:MAG: ATP-binding cassette domain-containing protein [Chitinophagaceae bacterium]
MSEKKQEEAPKKPNKKSLKTALRIYQYILPYKSLFVVGLVFLFLSSATTLIFPYITGELVDAATGENTWLMDNINQIAIVLVAILVFQAVFSYFRIVLFAKVSERAMGKLRKDLFEHILRLPIHFFEKNRVGELTSRLTSDISQVQTTFSVTLAEFLRQVITLIVGIILIFFISVQLTLLMLATFPVLVLAALILGRFIRKLSKKTQDELATANVTLEESLQSIQVVKAFSNEKLEANRYSSGIDKVVDLALKTANYRAFFVSFVIFALFGAIVLVLWFGASLVQSDTMTIGELTAFIIYTTFIGGAVGGMGDIYGTIQKTLGATDRLIEILNEPEEKYLSTDTEMEENSKSDNIAVRFNHVRFNYPSRPELEVLSDIHFEIERNSKIAIVGPSGAGKSTIVQLLLNFYQPLSGKIEIDGKNMEDYTLSALRDKIGLVPQEVQLFGGSIRENILYGKNNASQEEIEQAATKANAIDFINSFPEGFETMVGERGIKLSGGQKQRIAISRAFLKNPEFLILDEATSSLDAESERMVQEALDALMLGRTTLIIAHRLSTIMKSDRIIVLNNGEIVESGSHAELIQNDSGLYNHLVNLQFTEH